jgi:hypothetical protein
MEYCNDCGELIMDDDIEYCSACNVALCCECAHGDYDEYFCKACYQEEIKPIII